MRGPIHRPRRRRRLRTMAVPAVLLLVVMACGDDARDQPGGDSPTGARDTATADTAAASSDPGSTRLEIRNVQLIVAPGIRQYLLYLSGREVSRSADGTVALDRPDSYEIRVEDAEVAIDYESLSTLLNERVFADYALISDVHVEAENDADEPATIQIEGMLNALPPVEFEIEGTIEPAGDGDLRVRSTSIQAFEVEVGGLLDLLDVEAEDILPELEERGIRVEGNDMILTLSRIMPPPRASGEVTGVRVEPDRMVILFGSAERVRAGWRSSESNYLYHRHGTIEIGRMTMTDADLRVQDQDPSDPFRYSLDRMNEQHVAGYAELRMDGGLVVHAVDLEDLAGRKP